MDILRMMLIVMMVSYCLMLVSSTFQLVFLREMNHLLLLSLQEIYSRREKRTILGLVHFTQFRVKLWSSVHKRLLPIEQLLALKLDRAVDAVAPPEVDSLAQLLLLQVSITKQ